MMYVILPDGKVVHAPPASKCNLGMNEFMELAKREGSTLIMMNLEMNPKTFFDRVQSRD